MQALHVAAEHRTAWLRSHCHELGFARWSGPTHSPTPVTERCGPGPRACRVVRAARVALLRFQRAFLSGIEPLYTSEVGHRHGAHGLDEGPLSGPGGGG